MPHKYQLSIKLEIKFHASKFPEKDSEIYLIETTGKDELSKLNENVSNEKSENKLL